jgi:hypothetical protein
MGFELTTLVVIWTSYIGSYKSNYHTITMALVDLGNPVILTLACTFVYVQMYDHLGKIKLCIFLIFFVLKGLSLKSCCVWNLLYLYFYSGTCLIRHSKGPGKCVRLYRMSEYSGFILVNRNTCTCTLRP